MGPHDISVREWGKNAKTRLELAWEEHRIQFFPTKRPIKKEDGISASRKAFKTAVFDVKRCARGVKALTLYRKAWDPTKKIFSVQPFRDWTIHAADAFQTHSLWKTGQAWAGDAVQDAIADPTNLLKRAFGG